MNGKIRHWLFGVAGYLILAAAWSILSTPGAALAKGKPPGAGGGNGGGGQTNFKVCVTFDNLPTDGVLSDDFPLASTPYCNKVDRVLAIVGDGFRLDTTKGARSLRLDFGTQEVPTALGNGFGLAGVDMRIAKQYVADASGELILDDQGNRQSAGQRLAVGSMSVGEIARAALSIRFFFEDSNGNEQIWLLGFADIPGADGGRNCADSAPVWVTRGQGNTWRIQTAPLDEPGGGAACLWEDTAVFDSGLFLMPFGITID